MYMMSIYDMYVRICDMRCVRMTRIYLHYSPYTPILIPSYSYTPYIHYTILGSGQDHPDDRSAGLPDGAQGKQGALHGIVVLYCGHIYIALCMCSVAHI